MVSAFAATPTSASAVETSLTKTIGMMTNQTATPSSQDFSWVPCWVVAAHVAEALETADSPEAAVLAEEAQAAAEQNPDGNP